ncbi:unnamed protein product [Ambrosiozyma monospora]|uniref:Unnamed protein product n=1 Tax=Ambrosiozyma monospora TaxID=43982 RepID=A0ACB5U231_AMBMO|nr:unnamed protein product [Ambrosiozyma monospora]
MLKLFTPKPMVMKTIAKPLLNSNNNLISKRYFTSSVLRFNEQKGHQDINTQKPQEETTSAASEAAKTTKKYSRKPLSRLPIGGEEDYSKTKLNESSVEFSTGKAFGLFLVVGGALTWVFMNEKKKIQLRNEAEQNRGVGKPLIGGPFNLIDTEGNPFTEKNLLGKFSIIYFGFTHCPDICPDELDKLGEMLNELKKSGIELQPIFITCDPARDTPAVVKEYLSDFHPDIIGLTGEYDDIKKCCRAYRVYFSTPRDVKPGQDYLVDHSIFFYLMDPEGQFIDVLGRNYEADTGVAKIKADVAAFQPKAVREKQKEGWFGFLYK